MPFTIIPNYTYPKGLSGEEVDYITFSWFQYKSNMKRGRGDNPNANSQYPPKGHIRLYMPESTPDATIGNTWNDKKFPGPSGKNKLAMATGAAGYNPMDEAGQLGLEAQAAILGGISGSELMAMKDERVFNPNVELLYDSPQLRQFTFNFNFTPRNSKEGDEIRTIIRQFKLWSSPAVLGGNMLTVPDLWKIEYRNPKMMGKFKPAALTAVTHQANSTSAYHMTFDDGMPVQYSLALQFKEVDIITRDDLLITGPDSVGY